MRVIVTRPHGDAETWVLALAQLGIDALALPLIEIRALSDFCGIAAAWQAWSRCDAVMFVSAAAVDHFFALRPQAVDTSAIGDGPRLWAPGPGTVAALLRHGVAAQRIDAPAPDGGQFDSEALWQQVAGQVPDGGQVMVVRGAAHDVPWTPEPLVSVGGMSDAQGQGRDWLAQQLVAAGAQLRFAVAYWRAPPEPLALQQAIADHAAGPNDVWLFTSAQAIGNLRLCLPSQDWSHARAMTTHPRIAAAARAAGFGVVWESRPALVDIAASIKSLQ